MMNMDIGWTATICLVLVLLTRTVRNICITEALLELKKITALLCLT